MNNVTILEWKQKCNCPNGVPVYEIEGGYRQNVTITKEKALELIAQGATIRHAADAAIDYAEDFDEERDYVEGEFLT